MKSIDPSNPDRQFLVDKHYADLRIKLGAKKTKTQGKIHSLNMKTINDAESVVSAGGLGDD